MKIYSIVAQKGGTGKSTTASILATGAVKRGYKALAIDLDAQGSLTYFMGGEGNALNSYDLLTGTPASEIIQHNKQGYIIPAGLKLARADVEFNDVSNKALLLQEALKPIKKKYDVIFIDNPPALGTLLVNSLSASTDVIIPINSDATGLQCLYQLTNTIKQVKSTCNSKLAKPNILITQYSNRTVLARDILEVIEDKAKELGCSVLDTKIRSSVSVKEAQLLRESLYDYAPRCTTAIDYRKLLDEIGFIER